MSPEQIEGSAGDIEYRRLHDLRLESPVEVHEPLVLISQIQRSGGTLLSQLFDGHPECHVHPGELHMGHRNKLCWPELRLDDDPERWFEALAEQKLARYARRGYSKAARHLQRHVDYDVFPFVFVPSLQREIFLCCAARLPAATERGVLDCYFTSFFNAWLDNENLSAGPKKSVIGFAAAFSTELANLERFFSTYPDGTAISIVRDPRGWFASARQYKEKYADVDRAIGLWRRSTAAALAAKGRWADRVVVVSYEELVQDTERALRRLCDRIGLDFSETLLTPTFNSRPIRADSSEPVGSYGVLPDRADAHRRTLDAETAARIEREAGDLYRQALRVASTG